MKHMWEEPFISGHSGSGAVFFSGCNLQCVYCQNHKISTSCDGREVSFDELHGIFDSLIAQGVHNINLVTPSHYICQLAQALREKKPVVPVVYNCSGYEGDIKALKDLVDIYLCDFKYGDRSVADKYSSAPDYPEVCLEALEEMYAQTGDYVIENGIMKKGICVRHLVLPSNIDNTLDVIDLFARFSKGKKIKFSLMSQYVPMGKAKEMPGFDRPITQEEYDAVLSYLELLGIEDGYTQDFSAASEKYIPDWDFS